MTGRLLKAALAYAAKGWAVFPLHAPLFDEEGQCTGCTCEAYRHSERCHEQQPGYWLAEDEHCTSPGKCPRVKWREKSTTDEAQIRRWWRQWPNANIGIDCGKSGLLVVDADVYKPDFAGAALLGLAETVAVDSPGGGRHEYFMQPSGARYTNRGGDLPCGVDVRGVGGYVVAPPSRHASGRAYAWRTPSPAGPAPLPAALRSLLDAAERTAAQRTEDFAHYGAPATVEKARRLIDRLAPWRVDDFDSWYTVGAALHEEFGGSAAALELWDRWSATSREGKYHPKECAYRWDHFHAGRGVTYGSLVYFAVTDDPRDPGGAPLADHLEAAHDFVKSTSFAPLVPAALQSAAGYRTDATDTRLADAILDVMAAWGNFTVAPGMEALRRRAGLGSKGSVHNALQRLHGWFVFVEAQGDMEAARITLLWGRDAARTLNGQSTNQEEDSRYRKGTTVQSTRDAPRAVPDYTRDKARDCYLAGSSRYVTQVLQTDYGAKVREAIANGWVLPALGEGVLRVLDALAEHGAMTRKELAEMTGKTASAIARATLVAERRGLLVSWKEDPRDATCPKTYQIVDDAQQAVEALEARMATYHLGAERFARAAAEAERQCAAQLQAHADGALALGETQVHTLQRRRLKALMWFREIAAIIFPAQPAPVGRLLELLKPQRKAHTGARPGLRNAAQREAWGKAAHAFFEQERCWDAYHAAHAQQPLQAVWS